MGNRRKLRFGGRRSNKFRDAPQPNVPQQGMMQIAGRLFAPDERPFEPPTPDEMFSAGIPEDEQRKITAFWANPMIKPSSNEPIIKVVPARHKGTDVGECYIHDDGQISLVLSNDAPQWALDEIKASAKVVGYDVETGTPDGSS